MLQFLRKVNRGLIVSAAVFMAVVIYLVALSIMQQRDKQDIKDVCEAFVQEDAFWRVLPVDYEGGAVQISEEEMDQFQSDMRDALSPYYIQNDAAIDNSLSVLYAKLDNQNDGVEPLVRSVDSAIVKYTDFSFDGNNVKVTFDMQVAVESVFPAAGNSTPSRSSTKVSNQITLQKLDGEWKIVYAYIATDNMGGMY
jgi:hypothetical protein